MISLKRVKWVFNPQDYLDIGFTHAQVPTPYVMDDRIRVFISGRVDKISHVFSLDISPPPDFEIISINKDPVFLPNKNIGTFDDEGVMPSCFIRGPGDDIYFFYSGWNSRNTIPYHNSTGIAKYEEQSNTISRLYDGPVLERNYLHPYLAVTPCVWTEGGKYKTLYVSGLSWKYGTDRYEPIYVIKEAISNNLLDWERSINQAVPSFFENECFANPTVHGAGDNQLIMFCSRNAFDFRNDPNNSYKLGVARRRGEDIVREPINWIGAPSLVEVQMQCYPSFIEWDGKLYVIYNGNSFGLTGFGIAEVLDHVNLWKG